MDTAPLKLMRSNMKSVGRVLEMYDRRVTKNELLSICENVMQSERGYYVCSHVCGDYVTVVNYIRVYVNTCDS